MNTPPDIVPAMTVGALLEAYPELEATLIGLSPQFEKLKNPVLRITVAKIVTLQQAAHTAHVPIEELVNNLRTAAGQHPLALEEVPEDYGGPPPDWLEKEYSICQLDPTETINAGGTPLPEVLKAADELPGNEILELITPIVPAPVIDLLRARGFTSWTREDNGTYRTFFFKGSRDSAH